MTSGWVGVESFLIHISKTISFLDMYLIQHNINSSLATRQGVKDNLKDSYEITYWDNVG